MGERDMRVRAFEDQVSSTMRGEGDANSKIRRRSSVGSLGKCGKEIGEFVILFGI